MGRRRTAAHPRLGRPLSEKARDQARASLSSCFERAQCGFVGKASVRGRWAPFSAPSRGRPPRFCPALQSSRPPSCPLPGMREVLRRCRQCSSAEFFAYYRKPQNRRSRLVNERVYFTKTLDALSEICNDLGAVTRNCYLNSTSEPCRSKAALLAAPLSWRRFARKVECYGIVYSNRHGFRNSGPFEAWIQMSVHHEHLFKFEAIDLFSTITLN
jgi:hypothetical protein